MITANPHRHEFQKEVAERTTPTLSVTLRDLDGAGIPASSLDALKLTLFNDRTGAIINARDHQNVLNTGIGTMSSAGVITLAFTAADTAVLDSTRSSEVRVALLEWDWTVSGAPKSGKCELVFVVRNLQKVPAS